MDKRIIKRTAVAAIFFLIVGGIAWGAVAILKPAPSCFDNRQNQGEEGVDCGGPCAPCELRTLRPIEVLSTHFFSIPSRSLVVVAKIRNPNLRWSAADLQGRWEVRTQDGVNIVNVPALLWLRAGETKEIVSILDLSPEIVNVGDVNLMLLGSPRWVSQEDTRNVPLLVRSRELMRPSFGEPRVEGILRNDSLFDLDRVSVYATLLDVRGEIVAAGSHELRTLRSSEERFFSIALPMLRDTSLVKEIRVSGDTNIFEGRNFLRR